jgi:hypothetical protein
LATSQPGCLPLMMVSQIDFSFAQSAPSSRAAIRIRSKLRPLKLIVVPLHQLFDGGQIGLVPSVHLECFDLAAAKVLGGKQKIVFVDFECR